jgi:hypothetical protein
VSLFKRAPAVTASDITAAWKATYIRHATPAGKPGPTIATRQNDDGTFTTTMPQATYQHTHLDHAEAATAVASALAGVLGARRVQVTDGGSWIPGGRSNRAFVTLKVG